MIRASQRRNTAMRSMSDRRAKDTNGDLNFKFIDTTALRTKSKRATPQQLFHRPTCQPPTPPTLLDTNGHKTPPQRPPRQQNSNIFFIL